MEWATILEAKFFSSIRWRFIVIYFLLVMVVMAIVGGFIVNRLENSQLEKVNSDMRETIASITNFSTYLGEGNWEDSKNRIQNTLDEWRFGTEEAVYVIANSEVPNIVASSVNTRDLIMGQNALSYKELSPKLVLEGLKGVSAGTIREDSGGKDKTSHFVQPVLSKDGKVQGIFYMVTNLRTVYGVIDDARTILTYATIVALFITFILGYVLADSITGPIRDVTKQAREMAAGNFNQKVEVKSDDEIGQLGSMFNFLTSELQETISRMDTERSKLETIFSYMAEGVLAIDRKGKLIHANPVARDILDLSQEALDKEEFWDLKRINIKNINYFEKSTLSGTSQAQIKEAYYNVRYAPYKNKLGADIGLIVVLQDITQEHNLDVLRKDFVANVGHELKTPITTIKSYTETLMKADMEKRASLRFLEIINKESDRMSRIVTDLLQLSNMDAQQSVLEIRSLDAYNCVTSVLESLQPMIRDKHHRIFLEIPEDVRPFKGDYHGTSQVLMNILSNAVKYTSYGGRISIKAKNYGSRVHIEVEDTGIGIPKRDLERIFERFYRVEKGRSRAKGGTGLGLSIAKQVMESMDGRIRIKSEFGVGTTVLLSFAMDQEEV